MVIHICSCIVVYFVIFRCAFTYLAVLLIDVCKIIDDDGVCGLINSKVQRNIEYYGVCYNFSIENTSGTMIHCSTVEPLY